MVLKRARKAKSISDIIRLLSEDTKGLDGPIWFRGHSNKDYKLMPSIYRDDDDNKAKEMHLLKRFKQDAISLLPRPCEQPHDWLFVMRHHGIPTRLLDWTESPLVATYFAVASQKEDGALWILRPIELNKQEGRSFAHIDVSLPSFDEDEGVMNDFNPIVVSMATSKTTNPIAFIYPRVYPRQQAQLSVYTIHHLKKIAIEEIGDTKHVWRYIIPKESKTRIKKELRLLNFGEFQLFPELEKLGKNLAAGTK